MKISKILFSILISSFFIVLSCDDEETVELYEPQMIDGDSTSLAYEKLSTYPSLGSIQSANPTTSDIETPYGFRILKTSSPSQSNFSQTAFTIDRESGIISYGNKYNTISAGTFSIDVGLVNTNGMAVYENAFELIILDVPLEVVIDKNEVEAGIFEQGVMATISYTDISGSDEITIVSYELIEPPAGFEINSSTGVISKVKGAVSGPNTLSVEITTNVGVVMAPNVLTVNVGESPTIEMFQQDGSTSLTKTVLSPNTAYTTSAPVLTGMNPTKWEVIFPTSLLNSDLELGDVIDFSSSFSAEEPSGKVSIAADAGLPLGTHTLGLKATNATDDEFEFEDVLTIEVEERWETTPVYENDFSAQGSQITFHKMTGTTDIMSVRNHPKAGNNPVLRFGIFGGGNTDGATELKIPVDGTAIKKLRINFYEAYGYQNWWANRYIRSLSYNESLDDTSSLDDSTWTVMEASWSGSSLWGSIGADVNTYNKISGVIDVKSSTKNVSFFIRLKRADGAVHAGGQWLLRNLNVEASKAFPAEEQ
ncbi:MAG: hypothetical protein P8H63_06820 [Flavobacteriaceae bacterium]|nr:hypothetical protein [Flavobacteriaceae bacterium]